MSKAAEALRSLSTDPLVPGHHADGIRNALAAVEALDIEVISKDVISSFVQSNRITELPLTLEQAETAWGTYFAGKPPHKSVKSRDDLPDAHIFAAAQDLLTKTGCVHFVCGDQRLAAALTPLGGAIVHSSVENLFQSGVLVKARTHWKRDEVWRGIQHNVPVSAIEAEVREMLEGNLTGYLLAFEFNDDLIPGDWTYAEIVSADGGEMVTISNPDDWGAGRMSFQVTCETDAEIQFKIPLEYEGYLHDWNNIAWSPDKRTIEAVARVRLALEGTVDVEVDLERAKDGSTPLLSGAGFDYDSLQVYVIDR